MATFTGEERDAILQDVKDYLQVPFDDESYNRRLTIMIEDAVFWLEDKLGECSNEDFLCPGNTRTLLRERVRYDRDGALDVFQNNYLSLILAEQNRRRIDDAVSQGSTSAES